MWQQITSQTPAAHHSWDKHTEEQLASQSENYVLLIENETNQLSISGGTVQKVKLI